MTLPTVPPAFPPRTRVKPILKWVGGKRWLVPLIAPAIHARLQTTGGRYVEPFLGGAAIALDLGLPNMILGDTCAPLVDFYLVARQYPKQLAWALSTLVSRGADEETYYKVREQTPSSPILAAARFVYLNKLGYNGVYRVNKSGGFNVPFGKHAKTPAMPSEDDFLNVARALADTSLATRDFEETLQLVREGDVVYCDPPYYKTFTNYSAGGFNEQDQEALANALKACVDRGAAIIASNSEHPRVRELYTWAFVTPIVERHTVSQRAEDRGDASAVLILSDETLLASFVS